MRIVCCLVLLCGLWGCGVGGEGGAWDAEDGEVGKADTAGIAEDTVEALGVLVVANTLGAEALRRDVRLSARVAAAVVARRGAGYTTLAQLDAVPGVGAVSISRMLAYARAHQLVPAALPTLPVPSWATVFAQPECSGPALTEDVKRRLLGDRQRLVLGTLQYYRRYDGPCASGYCGARYEMAPVARLALVKHVVRVDFTTISISLDIEPLSPAETAAGCLTNVPGGRCDTRGYTDLQVGPGRTRITRDCVSVVSVSGDTGQPITPVTHGAKGGWSLALPPFNWLGAPLTPGDFAAIPVDGGGERAPMAFSQLGYYGNGDGRFHSQLGTGIERVVGLEQVAADATHAYYSTVTEDECGIWRVAHGASVPEVMAGWDCYPQYGRRTVPVALALDATHVYYATTTTGSGTTGSAPTLGTQVLKVAKADLVATSVASSLVVRSASRARTSRLAVDATSVYWAEPYAGRVLRAPKVGSGRFGVAATVLAEGLVEPNAVTLDGDTVLFLVADRSNWLRSVPRAGGAVRSVPLTYGYLFGSGGKSLAVDAQFVYVGGRGGILRLPKAGGVIERVADGPTILGSRVVLIDGFVLWNDAGGLFALER